MIVGGQGRKVQSIRPGLGRIHPWRDHHLALADLESTDAAFLPAIEFAILVRNLEPGSIHSPKANRVVSRRPVDSVDVEAKLELGRRRPAAMAKFMNATALQYGVFAANYPLAEEDLETGQLPRVLVPHRQKLYGLIVKPERLQHIRSERRPGSRYASAQQVQYEVSAAQALYAKFGVPYLDVTECSIEEIASRIMDQMALARHARS